MVTKKNRKLKKIKSKKKTSAATRKKLKTALVSKKAVKQNNLILQINLLIKNISESTQRIFNISKDFVLSLVKNLIKVPFLFINIFSSTFKNLIKAPFLFINIFSSTFLKIVNYLIFSIFSIFKKILTNIFKFKEVFFGIFFSIVSGGIGAILAVSYLEFNSSIDKKNQEISEKQQELLSRFSLIEESINDTMENSNENKLEIEKIKLAQNKLLKSEGEYIALGKEINELNDSIKLIEKQTYNIDSDLSILRKDLKNNSRLILSSSKTELSNRLYLAQSLLDRLQSGVPYSPQLEALGKEGLDPALLRFANGGAPTLKDLEARLSARAGEQLDADRTKKDTSWKENLKKEISKYVKIKPTNINEIEGVTGALLRAEQSISRGNLAEAIEEISSVPLEERGPLEAWLKEAVARQNADIAARNILARTTAALQQKN